ncbi:MAG: PDZ domain-containing protein [Armatimonadota bacterium]
MLSFLGAIVLSQGGAKPPVLPVQEITTPVEVPFRTSDTAIIVDAEVNGKKVSLMFDTGFGGFVLCDAGINLGKPDGKMGLRDFVGSFDVDTVTIKSLKLGSMSIPVADRKAAAVLREGADNSLTYGQHCDGIMGFSVISENITEINFEKKKFIFYPKTYDISTRKPDGVKTFLSKLIPAGHSSLEMLVKTEAGKSLVLALDTGNSFYITTHKDVLDRVGVMPLSKRPTYVSQSYVASGPVDSYSVQMPKMFVFGVPVESSVWDIIDLPSSSAEGDGTVGFGFLKNFNVTIDYQRRRVWMENFTGKTTDEKLGEAGMFTAWDDKSKNWIVSFIVKGGPAEAAGIKRGDVFLGFGTEEVGNIGYLRMRKRFQGPAGSEIKLTLSRKGELYRKSLTLTPLVNLP